MLGPQDATRAMVTMVRRRLDLAETSVGSGGVGPADSHAISGSACHRRADRELLPRLTVATISMCSTIKLVPAVANRRHEPAAGCIQTAVLQLLRQLNQIATDCLADSQVHRFGRLGHQISLACGKLGAPRLTLVEPEDDQVLGSVILLFGHDWSPGIRRGPEAPFADRRMWFE